MPWYIYKESEGTRLEMYSTGMQAEFREEWTVQRRREGTEKSVSTEKEGGNREWGRRL